MLTEKVLATSRKPFCTRDIIEERLDVGAKGVYRASSCEGEDLHAAIIANKKLPASIANIDIPLGGAYWLYAAKPCKPAQMVSFLP